MTERLRDPHGPDSGGPAATVATVPVSVAMATCNGGRYLAEQLDTLLAALAPDDELVVVDDASSDGTWEHLLARTDPRIRAHRNPANLGVRETFQKALSLTRHELVFLADQDDVWDARKRDAMAARFAADPRVTVVVSDARVIDATGRPVAESFMATRGGFDGSLAGTLRTNRFLGCAMALRRGVIEVGLPIPARAPMHDMWLGVVGCLMGRVAYLPEPLIGYRRHGANASPARSPSRRQALRWRADLVAAAIARLPAILAWRLRGGAPRA